jgi:hypothetical protein
MDTAVREADRLYVAALRAGSLLPDPSLIEPDVPVTALEDTGPLIGGGFEGSGGFTVRVPTPDDQTLQVIQALIAGTPGVVGVRLQSLVLGGESVLEIVADAPRDELRYALDARGLRLDGGVIRRKVAGDAPLAPPAAQEEQLQETDEPAAGGRPKSLLPGTEP